MKQLRLNRHGLPIMPPTPKPKILPPPETGGELSWSEVRQLVFAKHGLKCWYCGMRLFRRTATLDHVQPRHLGGSDEPENLVPCCQDCNFLKGHRTLEQFRNVFEEISGTRVFAGEISEKGNES
jgi:hypothetical protein